VRRRAARCAPAAPAAEPLAPPAPPCRAQAAHGRASQGGLLYTVPEEEVLATKSIQREVAQYGHLNEYVRKKP
jgi:hypothetical protein